MPLAPESLKRHLSLWQIITRSGHRRIPLVRQLGITDCGAASLAMVLAYHGKSVSLDELRNAVGTGRHGSSAAALLRAARSYGLMGRGVRADIGDLRTLPVATILFWESRHFVVFEKLKRDCVQIVDPAIGRRSIPIEHFRRAFTGVALIFEPSENFVRGESKPKRSVGLFQEMLVQRGLLARIISASLLGQLLSLALPVFTGVLIDRVVPRENYSLLLVLTVGYCLFQAVKIIADIVRAHLLIHLRTNLELRCALRFLDHLLDLPFSFFQQHTGDLMARLGSNSVIEEMLSLSTLSALIDGTMTSLYLAFLILASPKLTFLVMLLAVARIALVVIIRRRQRRFPAQGMEVQGRLKAAQMEILSGMETLKAMGLEHLAAKSWSNVIVDGLSLSIKRDSLDAIFNALLSSLGVASNLVLMFYGTFLVLNGTFTLGTMIAFSAIAIGFLGPIDNLVTTIFQLQMLGVYLERINDVLDTAPELDNKTGVQAGKLSGGVALENVSFRYSAQEPLVIEGVTVDIKPGSRLALVGQTGAGKSTLARLIAGLYDPNTGRILLDGRDLKTMDRRSVGRQLGVVTQETQLFSGCIRHNIALSDPEMGLDRVIEAAKLACLHNEIIAMPMGYETPLADSGRCFSGGQRQRLALARALAGNPRILLLDEATSHLDALTEEEVNRNLASLRCTRIVIAHRLSTIRDADLILVMQGGKVIEQGTHDELLKSGLRYASLFAAQSAVPTSVHPT
jgi:ATP-binding cassette, subfamily B, bacterial